MPASFIISPPTMKHILESTKETIKQSSFITLVHNWSSAIWRQSMTSDIDLTCIVENNQDINCIQNNMESDYMLIENEKHNGKYICSSYLVDDTKVDIAFFIQKDFLDYINHFYDTIENYKDHVSRIKHKIIDSIILDDKTDFFSYAKEKVSNYPDWKKNVFLQSLFQEALYHIQYLKESGTRNIFERKYVIRDTLTPLCMALYILHDDFFMLGCKRLHYDLPTFKIDLTNEFTSIMIETYTDEILYQKLYELYMTIYSLS